VQYAGKPSNADTEAALFKSTFIEISASDVSGYKQYISAKSLIAISFKVFSSWYSNESKIEVGLITMPDPGETPFPQGHSVAIVGFQDDQNTPGGGYFIIRNSWGRDWGPKNHYGSGYGLIPYEYISEYCMEAYVC
jgi:C1A family cysteine protease